MKRIAIIVLVLVAFVAWTQTIEEQQETRLTASEEIVGTWIRSDAIAAISPDSNIVFFHVDLTAPDTFNQAGSVLTLNVDGTGTDGNDVPLVWGFAWVPHVEKDFDFVFRYAPAGRKSRDIHIHWIDNDTLLALEKIGRLVSISIWKRDDMH